MLAVSSLPDVGSLLWLPGHESIPQQPPVQQRHRIQQHSQQLVRRPMPHPRHEHIDSDCASVIQREKSAAHPFRSPVFLLRLQTVVVPIDDAGRSLARLSFCLSESSSRRSPEIQSPKILPRQFRPCKELPSQKSDWPVQTLPGPGQGATSSADRPACSTFGKPDHFRTDKTARQVHASLLGPLQVVGIWLCLNLSVFKGVGDRYGVCDT